MGPSTRLLRLLLSRRAFSRKVTAIRTITAASVATESPSASGLRELIASYTTNPSPEAANAEGTRKTRQPSRRTWLLTMGAARRRSRS